MHKQFVPKHNLIVFCVKIDLPVDTARWEEKRKTGTIMEASYDRLYKKQKKQKTDIFRISECLDDSSCKDRNNNRNNNNNNNDKNDK